MSKSEFTISLKIPQIFGLPWQIKAGELLREDGEKQGRAREREQPASKQHKQVRSQSATTPPKL